MEIFFKGTSRAINQIFFSWLILVLILWCIISCLQGFSYLIFHKSLLISKKDEIKLYLFFLFLAPSMIFFYKKKLLKLFSSKYLPLDTNTKDINTKAKFSIIINLTVFFMIFLVVSYSYPIGHTIYQDGAMHHYSYFFGPIFELMYGNKYLLEVDAQYGFFMAYVLSFYFKFIGQVTILNFLGLLKILTFIGYAITYYICYVLTKSKIESLIILVITMTLSFFSQGVAYWMFPSIGFLRFGWIYIVILAFLLKKKFGDINMFYWIIAFLSISSLFWSFESAVYTIPAVFVAVFLHENFKMFFSRFIILFFIFFLIFLLPSVMHTNAKNLIRFFEYPYVYSQGFGQIPLPRGINNVWLIFPFVYGYYLIYIMLSKNSEPVITLLTVYGVFCSTYYIGRAHPNNLFHISIPLILLISYYIHNNIKNYNLRIFLLLFGMLNSLLLIKPELFETNFSIYKFIMRDSLPPLIYKNILKKENYEEINCEKYRKSFNQFKVNNSLAILSANNMAYKIYACTKTNNYWGLNPFLMISLNKYATERILNNLKSDKNLTVLIDKDLFNQATSANKDYPNNEKILKTIISVMNLKFDHTFKVDGINYSIYRN